MVQKTTVKTVTVFGLLKVYFLATFLSRNSKNNQSSTCVFFFF